MRNADFGLLRVLDARDRRRILKKVLACCSVAAFLLSAAACSSSSSSAASAITCPTLGEKYCPNSEATSQSLVDGCNKCLSSYQAYGQCAEAQGAPAKPVCDSNGDPVAVSGDTESRLLQNCDSQEATFSNCLQGSTGDGGS